MTPDTGTHTDYSSVCAWIDGTLAPADKLEVHLKGIKHKAVSVFVMDGSKVLLQKRADGKYHTPGLWTNTCCTHPLWGEAPLDCATRRVREELGISGLDPLLRHSLEYRADVGGGLTEHEVVDIFVAEWTGAAEVTPNPDEVSDVRWCEMDDLVADVSAQPEVYTPWLRIYLASHRDRIFQSE
jgi:isopentenyl-diphosphate delta-isomerase